MTRASRRWITVVLLVALAGCGPEVRILVPAEGEIVVETSIVARMEFSSPARTFSVVLDGADVSNGFFVTSTEAAGKLNALTTGDHVLSVEYLSKAGFLDSDQVVFSVEVPEPPVELTSISVEPSTLSLAVGAQESLEVTGHLSDGSTQDLTGDPATAFGSLDATIASVSDLGEVTALVVGSTTIGVQHGSLSPATVTVTVTAAPAPAP